MIQPVGAMIKPPDPSQGINTISGFLKLKQLQQDLQTGAYQQQQEQLKTAQAQGVQSFFQTWDPSEHVADDGSTDLDSALQSKEFKSAGNAKPAIMQHLLDIKNKQLDNKKQLATLNGDLVNQFGTGMGALAKDDDVVADKTDPTTGVNTGRAKIDQFLGNFSKLSPDAARIAQIYGPITQHAPPGKLADGVAAMQLQAESAREQQAQQNPAELTVDTGAATNVYNVNHASGLQPGQQPALTFSKPPESVPGPGGQILNRNRQTGALSLPPVAGAPTGGGGTSSAPSSKLPPMQRPGLNAPAADQANYNTRVQQLGQEYQAVSTAANDPMNGVQATRFRNQQILELVPHATTGPGMRLLNTVSSRLPGSTGDAYQDLEHYLSQNSAAMAKTMGVPSTNLGAETAAAAAGNVERNPGALREITRTNDALNTAMDLYNRGYAKVTNNGSDMSRAASYKQAFGQNLDINAIRWADAHRRGDQDELADLTKKLGPQGVKAAQQKLRVLKSLSANGDLP